MKKLISILLMLAMLALPAKADSTCDRVQNAVNSNDTSALVAILSEQTGASVDVDNVTITVVSSPVTGNECRVTWQQIQEPSTQLKAGCVFIVLGLELGLIGVTIYVVYKVCNPPPPPATLPGGPDTIMYMDPQGHIWEVGGPVIN